MSETVTRLPLALTEPIATEIVEQLAPYCERICVAGSIRRRRPTIGDVELVVIPILRARQIGLFGEQPSTDPPVDLLDEHLTDLLREGCVAKRRDGRGRTFWGPSDKRLVWKYGPSSTDLIAVDIFGATAVTFGAKLALRTGPWQLSKRLVTPRRDGGLLPLDLRFREGGLYRRHHDAGWRFVPTPDEESLFAALGLPYLDPEHRTATAFDNVPLRLRS